MTRFRFFLPVLVLLFAMPCAALAEPTVFVSIVPQQYFVEKIAGDAVASQAMVLPGQSPATYEPSPRQMAALSEAAAYLAIGVPFERAWLPRFREASPGLRIVHVDEGIQKRAMEAHHHHGEEHHHHEAHAEEDHHAHGHEHGAAAHGHEHDAHGHDHDAHKHDAHDHDAHAEAHAKAPAAHEHTGLDPHVWLAPEPAKVIARNTFDALAAIFPDKEAEFRANLDAFLAEIDSLDARIREILTPIPPEKRRFLVFHPSWGYFADAFDLEQLPIEVEGKEPGPAELARIVKRARDEGIAVVFVQPQFSATSAQVAAREIGGRVEKLDPLAEDWADNLERAAAAFQKALAD